MWAHQNDIVRESPLTADFLCMQVDVIGHSNSSANMYIHTYIHTYIHVHVCCSAYAHIHTPQRRRCLKCSGNLNHFRACKLHLVRASPMIQTTVTPTDTASTPTSTYVRTYTHVARWHPSGRTGVNHSHLRHTVSRQTVDKETRLPRLVSHTVPPRSSLFDYTSLRCTRYTHTYLRTLRRKVWPSQTDKPSTAPKCCHTRVDTLD